jgi:hypothetical protein
LRSIFATGFLIISGNLNITKKAILLTIGNSLMQYSIEEIKNIDFPPIYYDKLKNSKVADESETDIISLQNIDSYTDFTPEKYKPDYRIIRLVQAYDISGNLILPTPDDVSYYYDTAMYLKFTIYILRKRDNQVLLKETIYRVRDGLY